jgi:hypothetical protein
MRITRFQVLCTLVLTATLGSTAAIARNAPFVVALPNGYEIMRKQEGQLAIVKRKGGAIVTAPITTYAVVRDVVTGVVPAPEGEGDKAKSKRGSKATPGYFILKTDTGEITQGLSEQEWKDRLKAMGVTLLPTLNPPILPESS